MEKKFDIIGVEGLILDFPIQIDEIPKTDGGTSMKDFSLQCGGNASNAIIAASRLGGKCAMLGTVGDDPIGKFCRHDMTINGVDLSHMKIVEGTTTLVICLAEEKTQGRSFIGKHATRRELTPEEIDESFICQAKAVHSNLSDRPTVKAAFEIAKKNGVLVSVDAAFSYPNCKEDAKDVDLLVMSEYFYNDVFGEDDTNYEENCKSFLQYGPKAVVVTLGGKGCAGADENGTFRLPVWKGKMADGTDCKIIDTTGAGDVYHGAFTWAWLNRRQAPYNYTAKECARFASAVSYINCTTLGGHAGLPTLDMVDYFLENQVILPGDLAGRKEYYSTALFHLGD